MAKDAFNQEFNFYKPEKRFIIPINNFHIPKKLFLEYKKKKYNFKINSNFPLIINNCSKPRKDNDQTWINNIIKDTYIQLSKEGIAKSIECFQDNKIVGGLYGIHLNGCFFGESMYSNVKNVSKLSLLYLVSILKENNFILLDSQFYNHHLLQFGAYEILDNEYQTILKKGLKKRSKFPINFDYERSLSLLHDLTQRS